jgi:hypothetical protein
MKGVVFRVVAIGSGFCIALIFIEVALRIWTPESLAYKSVRSSDPVRHHKLEPSRQYIVRTKEFTTRFATNSLGLRDNEWNRDAKSKRVIVLGDSFVEGVGVEVGDGVVQQLEVRLNNQSRNSARYEVFNFGIAGYSPILEYLYLKETGIALKPDLVILCYDMTDVQEDYGYAEDAEFDSDGVPIRVHPSWPSFGGTTRFPRSQFKTFIQENSYFYTLISDVLRNTSERRVEAREGDIHSGRYAHTLDSTAEKWKKYFEVSKFYVKLIAELCRTNNTIFVLSVHPRGHQVSENEWRIGRTHEGIGDGVYESAIFSSLEHFARKFGIPFLNMTKAFKGKSRGDLYYQLDGHWTARGNSVAADTLFEFLIRNHIISN